MQLKSFMKRMNKEKLADFKKDIDSMLNCTECGECIQKCPYELPIPQTIKENYEVYKNSN
jgi:predicted aldo/keto reductase-like oxidoreductase